MCVFVRATGVKKQKNGHGYNIYNKHTGENWSDCRLLLDWMAKNENEKKKQKSIDDKKKNSKTKKFEMTTER